MAKVRFGIRGMTMSGKVGNGIFRTLNDETVYQQAPRSKKKKDGGTPKQKRRRQKTIDMGAYGKYALAHPELRPVYEAIAAWEKKPLVSMANRDQARPPLIEAIDVSAYRGNPGDPIAIAASDDTGVVRVDVALKDPAGRPFESRTASLHPDGWWLYTATTNVPDGTLVRVAVQAMDRAQRKASGDVEFVVDRSRPRARRPRRTPFPKGLGHPALRAGNGRRTNAAAAADDMPNAFSPSDEVPLLANSLSDEADAIAYSLSTLGYAQLDPAELLRRARARAGLSQRALAEVAGTAQSVVSRIERRQSSPTVETLLTLLRAAGFDLVVGLADRSEESDANS